MVIMQIVDGINYLDDIKKLIIEYITFLNRDLGFQNLEEELNDLKTKYTYPNGRIIVASVDEKVVSCVAFYKHNSKRCEMKRLYVKKEYRNFKIGQELVEEIITLAKKDGYQEMVLDTIKPLTSAINLYKKMGFKEIKPYYNNPMPDVIYMKLSL